MGVNQRNALFDWRGHICDLLPDGFTCTESNRDIITQV